MFRDYARRVYLIILFKNIVVSFPFVALWSVLSYPWNWSSCRYNQKNNKKVVHFDPSSSSRRMPYSPRRLLQHVLMYGDSIFCCGFGNAEKYSYKSEKCNVLSYISVNILVLKWGKFRSESRKIPLYLMFRQFFIAIFKIVSEEKQYFLISSFWLST
jgi:hypothetical protein